ncbi:hypothetical protein CKAN_02379800 [Cinnamomum micranthum f. kanehirae]|uniref:Uncharacterized protein n=1 Tax=Cinnamomum micranthum f. kanehirae TaxID=337451 RepID=A0A3S3P6F6_9MAGN|nr:hypothetical protein CKAN_02379800 [Cinnamomum micranthum f. kanehirae]
MESHGIGTTGTVKIQVRSTGTRSTQLSLLCSISTSVATTESSSSDAETQGNKCSASIMKKRDRQRHVSPSYRPHRWICRFEVRKRRMGWSDAPNDI